MVRVTEELALSPDHISLYWANDPLLGHLPVLIFHGHSTTANYTLNSSRIQVHVYSPAGLQSYPRLTISPNSPFYGVVNHLPREFQGDEVCRGLAFGLFKYFKELPDVVKTHLKNQFPTTRARRPGSAPALFGEQHAADLAKAMVMSEHTVETLQALEAALQTQHISNVDIDFVLPPGSIIPLQLEDLEDVPENEDDILDPTLRQYGMYTPFVKLLGEPVFLPTSKLRRAPSKPSSLNRSKSFTKDQKMELRMKLGELVDTEERYVLKLNELVKHIADEFRQNARKRPSGSTSPSEEDLDKLFPRSADRILQINSSFMQALRKAMDESEGGAAKDFDVPFLAPRIGGSGRVKDPSGALAMTRIFLEWFPKFTDCYQDYIRASQDFPRLLNSFLDQQSSFRQRVMQTGEQTIRSILIEPVQRLPRYSLFIDQIVGCLPITHPALQPMLKARDIIANICSMDDPLQDKPHVSNRLRNMVESWPVDLEPQGRLLLAMDFVELAAPHHASHTDTQDRAGILVLFTDCIVILKKINSAGLSGRDLLREIDKPSPAGLLASMTNAAGGQGSYDLAFAGWHILADVRFTESADGHMIWMTSTQEMKGVYVGEHVTSKAVTSRCFLLQELGEGKAVKWSEDVVKARIEGRFPEFEREEATWTLRSTKMPDSNLGLHAAVFQEGLDRLVEGRKEPAPIRVVIDNDRGTKSAPVGHYGVEIVVEVRSGDMQRISMNTMGLNGKRFTDDIAIEDFVPTLSRRIIQLLSTQYNVSNLQLAPALVSYHTKVLRSLNFSTRAEKTRSFLAASPVKMLSSFLTGATTSESSTSVKQLPRTPLGNVAVLFPSSMPRSNSLKDTGPLSSYVSDKQGSRTALDEERPENPLVRLEQTFTAYVASLQSRKGQFVGRTLFNRSAADELSVNDLYNKLIENPFDWESSDDLPAEVVFVAFEKFIRTAWREQMGQVMSMQSLDALQERATRRVPGDFADFVKYMFSDMAPQNRRAFTAVIKLLADLLDGCGNDGDRGALTLAFAELLVDDGSAPNYINLLDRLEEDCDRIFEEIGYGSGLQVHGSAYESIRSPTRAVTSQTGSVTSNTSSLRRKWGFDILSRQNSKPESDRPSMWRTLSKHGRNPATGDSSSLSKASVNRSRSIDMGIQEGSLGKLRRPASRDRPPIVGAFDDANRPPSSQRPNSSHRMENMIGLETIGEPEAEPSETSSLKKKRRSSLSDLKSLMEAASLEDDDGLPLMPLRINKQQTAEKFNSTPRIPPPSKIPISPPGPQSMRSPRQKENFRQPLDKAFMSPPPVVRRGHSKTLSTSQIPTLKISRQSGGEAPASPTRPTSSPTKSANNKLRLQSPQKLRERLQTEKKAVEGVDAGLRSELHRITQDMARVNGMSPRVAVSTDLRALAASVAALQNRVPAALGELTGRHEEMQREVESSLRASEAKVKAIDQLYREAMAENELLYERFNTELGKIVKALRGKGKELDKEELVTQLKEQSEETARTKKENARLRREMASLRAAMKGSGGGSFNGGAVEG